MNEQTKRVDECHFEPKPIELIDEVATREQLYDRIPKGGVGAELGVARGQNSVQLWHHAKPERLYLCDIWKSFDKRKNEDPHLWYDDHYDYVHNTFLEHIEQGNVILYKGYSLQFLASMPDQSLDWIYIDANHHYQSVSREIDLSILKVKKGGLIMGHDFDSNPRLFGTSVIRAVIERVQSGNLNIKCFSSETWPSYMAEVL